MSDDKTLYVCDMNLRNRSKGIANSLITAGTPFDGSILDDHTREIFEKRGQLRQYTPEVIVDDFLIEDEKPVPAESASEKDLVAALKAEALEKYGVSLPHRKLTTLKKAVADLEKKAADKPTGIFNLKASDLEGLDLDELDSLHADICSENGLGSPDPFKTLEQAVEKLTSEA